MEKNKIGIFDSGIGGSTVFREILKILPNEQYIYYSDSINNPYGDKSDEEIYGYCEKIVNLFIEKGCKSVVIACNTASAKCAKRLRENYRDLPIVAIEPAYKMIYDYAYDKPTLVMATAGTLNSEKFNDLYTKYDNHKTILLACKGLADIIEKGNEAEINKYLKENLSKYKDKVENVVLGCTHYPLIINNIKEVLGNVTFFDGSFRLAIHLKDILENKNLLNKNGKNSIEFMDSTGLKVKSDRFFEIINQK